jgi:hypothetical protein
LLKRPCRPHRNGLDLSVVRAKMYGMSNDAGPANFADITTMLLHFGERWQPRVDVGEGWYALVLNAHRQLLAIDPDIRYAQIKEKFGDLQIYLDQRQSPAMTEVIRAAERRAAYTCEICGEEGELRTDRAYVRVLCDTDAATTR